MWTISEALLTKYPCEHLTAFPVSAEEFSLQKSSGTELSVPSKRTNIVKTSLSITKTPEILSRSRFGTISQHLTVENGKDILILFKEDFRVKKSVPVVTELASRVGGADSGKRCSASFAKFDRSTFSWKMSPTYLDADLAPSLPIFPSQGTMRNGVCFPRPPLDPAIDVTGSGFLRNVTLFPTPSTYGVGGSWGKCRFKEIFGIDSRKMNPMWLANIMGFPTDWTHIEVSVTRKYRSVRQWLSLFYTSG